MSILLNKSKIKFNYKMYKNIDYQNNGHFNKYEK
jgi:hypothetical protein